VIINSLNSLRNDLRDTEGDLKPSQMFAPFLEILRAPQLSGPFMATALDAIQTFLSCQMVLHVSESASDLLLDVIEAVSR
jgi:hypothetical protein